MTDKPYQVVREKVEQLEKEINIHRREVTKRILFIVILVVLIVVSMCYIYNTRAYTSYQVIESIERADSPGTKFVRFQGNILKYSNDGIFCIDEKNQLIWNQAYEMQSPMLDICQGYAVIADEKGKKIYIMDADGPCGEIDATRPIQQVHVANQGMVAILMEESGTGYIQLYDKEGNFLVEGELHAQNSGYPLDIAISDDGRKMVVTMLDINEGRIKTTIAFYNFGSVGQNEIDNIVSSYPYADTIMAKVEFLTNDIAVAIGDNKMMFYEGNQKPVVSVEVPIKQEIKSVFYNENYVGLVFDNENKEKPFRVEVYNTNGKKTKILELASKYERIEFLENNEICILNNQECSIYTLGGIRRFYYEFEEDIYKVIHQKGHQYMFLLSGYTEKVKLK